MPTVPQPLISPRTFAEWLPHPLISPRTEYREAVSVELLVRTLDQFASVPTIGRALFQGSNTHVRKMQVELGSYIRQALTYYRAAEGIHGSSASLPLYYAALNLAKAELLITNPTQIVRQRIHHGLLYDPQGNKTLKSHRVRVASGVYPMLYKKRKGMSIATRTALGVPRLLANIPEISWELQQQHITPNVFEVYHTVALDQSVGWSLLAFPGHFSPYSDITSRRIRASYVLVKPPSPHRGTWRDTFALSKRHLTSGFYFFQSKWTVPRLAAPNLGQIDAIQVSQLANQRLTPYVQEASEETFDGAIAGSIFKSKLLAMPSSLARYESA